MPYWRREEVNSCEVGAETQRRTESEQWDFGRWTAGRLTKFYFLCPFKHMSLLVANYGSDSESDSDHEQPKQQKTQSSLASSLPPPKKKADNASGKVQIYVDLPKVVDDDDNSEDEKTMPTIKRPKAASSGPGLLASLLPAPKNAAPSKKQTDSTSTAANAPVKSTSFIPPAIAKRKAELQAAAKRTEEAKVKNDVQKDDVGDDESDQDEQYSGDDDTTNAPVTSFFPLGKTN